MVGYPNEGNGGTGVLSACAVQVVLDIAIVNVALALDQGRPRVPTQENPVG